MRIKECFYRNFYYCGNCVNLFAETPKVVRRFLYDISWRDWMSYLKQITSSWCRSGIFSIAVLQDSGNSKNFTGLPTLAEDCGL